MLVTSYSQGEKVIFDVIVNHLKDEMNSTDFERYIKQLTFVEERSKSDLVVISVPNLLLKNWIATKYSDKIAHLFEVHTGVRPAITFVVQTTTQAYTNKETEEAITTHYKSAKISHLNPSFTFDSFVVGSSNQFSYTASVSVAEKPGKVYNPLFLYGGVGLGKTHLLQAIGNRLALQQKSVIYATIEQFINDFTYNLRHQTMDRFRDKYRECDLLLIDDVQFLSRKEATQVEFFHTFVELIANGKQIVMTSDKHPKKIAGLDERLLSRFEAGLIADIQPPELETKIAIIEKKCELNGIKLGQDTIDFIASSLINSNIREIEGIITRLNAFAKLMGQEITLEFAKNILKEQIKEQKENVTIDNIVEVIAREMNVKPAEIKSKSRSSNIVNARRMVIYLARTLTPNSMPIIANYFGMKDHTAVSHSIKKINELISKDANIEVRINELINKIKTDDA